MVRVTIDSSFRGQFAAETDRKCGSCYACCVYLGIEELKKYSNQTCKHLSGGSNPDHRCSIYADRPKACRDYLCLWLAGWGPEEMRPADSGILITAYPSHSNDHNKTIITIIVFDEKKAAPHVKNVLGVIVGPPEIEEIRLVYTARKKATLFKNGKIYDCDVLPPEGYESLMFAAYDPPIGTYHTVETEHE